MPRLNVFRGALVLALLTLGTGCRIHRSSAPPELDDSSVLGLEPTRAWRVESAGKTVGSVVHFRETTPPHRVLFAVRNIHDQDVGRIDAKGRAWRERPHQEPDWVGTGTVTDGIRLILGLAEEPELRELPTGALRGSRAAD